MVSFNLYKKDSSDEPTTVAPTTAVPTTKAAENVKKPTKVNVF